MDEDRPPNCNMSMEVGGLRFDSCFDSGNLAKVQYEGNEYRLWVGPDCAGTPHETSYTAWFHFSVQGGKKGQSIALAVMNSNPLKGLYGSDMRPVYRCHASKDRWERLPTPVKAKMQGDVMRLCFRFRFEEDDDRVYFAFCYPWSYEESQEQLAALDATYAGSTLHPSIYYHRELLTTSVEGRRIDIVTISSRDGIRAGGPGLTELGGFHSDPHVFPERKTKGTRGPLTFEPYKKVVLVTARVHPGETPASYVFNGFLNFILKEDDPRARQLRRQFVFKLVPMLNPDGVVRGHYRLDTQGLNLNRHYINPDPVVHPAIYAVRALVLHLDAMSSLLLYMDLHAHAAKKGCFFYGNQFDRDQLRKQIATQLFARVAATNSPFIEYGQCVFTEKNMKRKDKRDKDLSKEGAGRVALYRATGLTYFYTLECNYNEGTRPTAALRTAAASGSARKGTPPSFMDRPPRTSAYTSESWENVGEGVAITLLDMSGTNPISRPPSTNTTGTTPTSSTRIRRRPSQDVGYHADPAGDITQMFSSLREQVLAGGNFDDQPNASSWDTYSSEWQWDGPPGIPEDDVDTRRPVAACSSSSSDASSLPAASESGQCKSSPVESGQRQSGKTTRSRLARASLTDDTLRRERQATLGASAYKVALPQYTNERIGAIKGIWTVGSSAAASSRSRLAPAPPAQHQQPTFRRPTGTGAPAGAVFRGRTVSLATAMKSLRIAQMETGGDDCVAETRASWSSPPPPALLQLQIRATSGSTGGRGGPASAAVTVATRSPPTLPAPAQES